MTISLTHSVTLVPDHRKFMAAQTACRIPEDRPSPYEARLGWDESQNTLQQPRYGNGLLIAERCFTQSVCRAGEHDPCPPGRMGLWHGSISTHAHIRWSPNLRGYVRVLRMAPTATPELTSDTKGTGSHHTSSRPLPSYGLRTMVPRYGIPVHIPFAARQEGCTGYARFAQLLSGR